MLKKLSLVFILISFFKIGLSAIQKPTNDLPADKSSKQLSCAQLQIKSSFNYKYVFEYSTSASFTNSVRLKPDYTGSSFANVYTKPLKFKTTYYWRAKSFSANDSSVWTDAWSFTTDTGICIYGPTNNYHAQSLGMYFAWYRNAHYSNYYLEIDTTDKFDSQKNLRTKHSDTFKWFYIEARDLRMQFNKTYYWRLQGINGNDSSGWINSWKFKITDTLKVFNPTDNYNGIATTVKIEWARDAYTTYQFEADTTTKFNTGKLKRWFYKGSDYMFFKNLDFDQNYYWRIRACGLIDTGRWMPNRKFKTDGVKNKDVFNTNGGLTPDYKFTWQWVDTATHYQFQADTVSTFNSPFLKDSVRIVNVKGTQWDNLSMTIYQMPFGQGIYHRVRPIHAADTGDWSKVDLSYVADKPSLLYPYTNLKDVLVWATFSCNKVSGAVKYKFQRDVSSLFNTKEIAEQISPTAAANMTKMNYNTTYYWRVKIYSDWDSSQWSNVQSFTTVVKPVLKSPTSFYTMGPGVAGKLVWDKLLGSSYYEIQYDTNSTFASQALIIEKVIGDSNNLAIKELYFGKIYYWRVRAMHEFDTSSWSAVWYFYTYNPVRLSSPINNQVGTTFYSIDWASINGTTGYHYMFSDDSTFATRLEGKVAKDNSFFHYFDKNPTNFNTKYWWKVRVFHAKDTATWSQTWNFKTRPRNGVKLTYPTHEVTNIPLGFSFTWQAYSGAVNYDIEYSENADMSAPVKARVAATTYAVSLKPLKSYYWHVMALNKDNVPVSDFSETFKYTTVENFIAPILISPANLSEKLATSVSFSWAAVKGTMYDIQIAEDSDFITQQTNSVVTNSVSFSGLKTNKSYYWRVRAKNQFATGPWSGSFTFKTNIGADLQDIENSMMKVYPNPVNSIVNIELPSKKLIKSVSIINALGQIIEKVEIGNTNKIELDISSYPPNIYSIVLEQGNRVFIYRILKN